MLLANAHNVTIQHGDAHDGDLWCICIIGPVTFSKFYSFYSSSHPVRSWQSGCDRYIVVLGGADVVLRRFTTAACLRSSYCTCSLNLRRQACRYLISLSVFDCDSWLESLVHFVLRTHIYIVTTILCSVRGCNHNNMCFSMYISLITLVQILLGLGSAGRVWAV